MKIQQLSVFVENQPGHVKRPCRLLADAGINILTLSLADTQQYGIMRMIVKDWKRAADVLSAAGCIIRTTEVVAVEVDDRPGGLADILDAVDACRLDIEYMYAFTFPSARERAMLVFRFSDTDAAVTKLRERGVNLVSSVELFDGAAD